MLTRLAILLPLLLTCFGCGTSYLEREHFEVNDFDINRLEVVFIKNARRPPVKLTITGAGVVELTTGSSPQLSDSFSIDTNNKEWNNIVHRRQTITRADARMIFQNLVNYGLYHKPSDPPDDWPEGELPERRARVNANFNGRMARRDVLFDQDLLDEIETTVRLFNR
ncbi:MAG: hypothetical protein ACI4QD_03030 [Kiritimatiellia bacterium]